MLELHYYKENEDQFTEREVEPYRLDNGREGWYVECYDRKREDIRHFKLDRIKEAKVTSEGFEPRREFEDIAASRAAGSRRRPGAGRRRRPGLGLAGAGPLGCARSTRWSRSSPTAPC